MKDLHLNGMSKRAHASWNTPHYWIGGFETITPEGQHMETGFSVATTFSKIKTVRDNT
jgi:hypothetical protein